MATFADLEREIIISGGKEVLLKIVALAIPMFAMSCFKIPKIFCFEFESIIDNFCWGQEIKKKKIHWIGWDKLCLPKFKGDMGFEDLNSFNLTLLAK